MRKPATGMIDLCNRTKDASGWARGINGGGRLRWWVAAAALWGSLRGSLHHRLSHSALLRPPPPLVPPMAPCVLRPSMSLTRCIPTLPSFPASRGLHFRRLQNHQQLSWRWRFQAVWLFLCGDVCYHGIEMHVHTYTRTMWNSPFFCLMLPSASMYAHVRIYISSVSFAASVIEICPPLLNPES